MKPRKSKLRLKIEDALLFIIVTPIVLFFILARSGLVSALKESARGTAWEPVMEFLTMGER